MPVETAVSKNDPKMIAWKALKQTEEYENAVHWVIKANDDQSAAGELWFAFDAGYSARPAEDAHAVAKEKLMSELGTRKLTAKDYNITITSPPIPPAEDAAPDAVEPGLRQKAIRAVAPLLTGAEAVIAIDLLCVFTNEQTAKLENDKEFAMEACAAAVKELAESRTETADLRKEIERLKIALDTLIQSNKKTYYRLNNDEGLEWHTDKPCIACDICDELGEAYMAADVAKAQAALGEHGEK